MPPGQTAAIVNPPVCATIRQPFQAPDLFEVDQEAIVDLFLPVRVILALAGIEVQHFTGKPGQVDLAGIFILKFQQAAAAASVTKLLPLDGGHLFKRFRFPKRFFDHCLLTLS